MTQIKTKIPAELEPAAVGGMVTDSKYVKDRVKNKTQEEVNADTEERVSTLEESVGTGGSVDSRIAAAKNEVIGDAGSDYNTLGKLEDKLQEEVANRASQNYTKAETYSKTELNNMITTPNQEYVTVTATDQTTAVTDVLPATGEADTVYRVGNWDGSQYDEGVYSEYSWTGSAYVHISTKTQVSEVFDISAAHATGGELATYDDLADALGTSGANIPQSLRKGGMSVKFVQSSDNKYVQWRLTSSSFSTDMNDWEGLPTFLIDKNNTTDTIQTLSVTSGTAVTRTDTEILFDTKYEAGKTLFLWLYPSSAFVSGAYIIPYLIKTDGTTVGLAPLNQYQKSMITLSYDIKGIYYTVAANLIASNGEIKFGIYIEKDGDCIATKKINQNTNVEKGVDSYEFFNYPNINNSATILKESRSIIVGGDNSKLRYVRNIWNYPLYLPNVYEVDDEYLSSLNLNKIDANPSQILNGGSLAYSKFLYTSDGDIFSKLDSAADFTYYRMELLLYSAHKDFPSSIAVNDFSGHRLTTTSIEIENTDSDYVKKIKCFGYINPKNNSVAYIYLNIVTTASTTYQAGEYGITGMKMALLNNNEINNEIVGDWVIDSMNLPILKHDVFSDKGTEELRVNIQSGYAGYAFNKVNEIREYLSMFIARYKDKAVDEYNRVLVSFNGDSIIGSQLADITPCPEYNTGAFPPNMSKMIMARMFFDRYRYANEDTIFRNLEHSDWVKQGFDVSNGKDDPSKTFNEIEVYGCQEGDYAQIEATGYSFFKLVWSEYGVTDNNSKAYSFNVLRSTDNGETFEQIDSISVNSDRSLMVAYKIYKINPSTSYIFKIVPTSGYADVCLWGCEMWNNPRLDVVVEAFSGTWTAKVLANKLDGYYSEYHKPALIITDILAINDYAVNPNMNWWLENSVELGKKIKEKGTLLLPMTTHGANFVKCGYGLWKSLGYSVIDILSKLKDKRFDENKNITNATDGLHLSNYGNSYFFEELKRVFDGVLLT